MFLQQSASLTHMSNATPPPSLQSILPKSAPVPVVPTTPTTSVTEEAAPSVDLVKHPSGIVPTLQYALQHRHVEMTDSSNRNVVSTCSMGCKLDLKTIALHARNAEYNPKVRT